LSEKSKTVEHGTYCGGKKSMGKTSVPFMGIFILLFLSFQCKPVTVQKTEKDSGETLKMHPKDRLEVVLKANPTTGYRWDIAYLDSTVLKHTGSEYIPDPVPKGILGSGGRSILRFEADKIGSTLLKFIYHRPFEKDVPPVKTVEFIVIVEE